MTLQSAILAVHIVCGFAGLALGPIAMFARKRRGWHTRSGDLYHGVMLAVCATAAALALLDWQRIWWFLLIAIGSYAQALIGYLAAKRRWQGWLPLHVSMQCGSYIALVTALLVVNWEGMTGTPGIYSPWAWILPTLVGSPLIAWINRAVRLGRRPVLPA